MQLSLLKPVRNFVNSFNPSQMPGLSRQAYRRELIAWSLLPIMTGAAEGKVVGVIVKNAYTGIIPEGTLNLFVAILIASKAFANTTSLAWAGMSAGKHKIRFANMLMVITMLLVIAMAFAPFNFLGIWIFLVAVIGIRVCWTGVVTIRTSVWAANYPSNFRAHITGRLFIVHTLPVAGVSAIIGQAMDWNPNAFRIVFPLAAVAGMFGTLAYASVRVRGHKSLRSAERHHAGIGIKASIQQGIRILKFDRLYRRFVLTQFVFGFGNLMAMAPLVIILKDQFNLDYFGSLMLLMTIPIIVMMLCIGLWSKLLDKVHIIKYRRIHSWSFVITILLMCVATITSSLLPLWIASVMLGVAQGGGILAWNLGHHDFAPLAKSSQYMGVHVTLFGIRGLLAPLAGVGLYQALVHWPAWDGPVVFAVSGVISAAGAIGFLLLTPPNPGLEGNSLSNPNPLANTPD